MLGRATRLCEDLFGDGQSKERFMIYDAVDLYAALEPYTSMKPVVTQPKITFQQLLQELTTVTDSNALDAIKDQLVVKLQQKKRKLKGERRETFTTLTGLEPEPLLKKLRQMPPKEIAVWFNDRSSPLPS